MLISDHFINVDSAERKKNCSFVKILFSTLLLTYFYNLDLGVCEEGRDNELEGSMSIKWLSKSNC